MSRGENIERILEDMYFESLDSGALKSGAKIYDYRFTHSATSKFIKKINLLLFAAIILIVAYMFHLKSEVQDLTFEYKQLANQLSEENKQFNLLKAELAYLNSPKRLQALASQYLNLDNIKPQQLSNESRASTLLTSEKFTSMQYRKAGSKWRYKKMSPVIKNVSIVDKKAKR
ncbi:MAG: hypothetical protein SFT91_05430 [Rickettsiaceae bacterium]|nr:hypothetical protein [Rickettsiaceae bacterium]